MTIRWAKPARSQWHFSRLLHDKSTSSMAQSITTAVLTTLVFCSALPARAAPEKRPNILLAFADDWGRYASTYAQLDGPGTPSDVLRTPNFDRVAREGLLFRRAFVSAPSCTPCRSALLSGQHFW